MLQLRRGFDADDQDTLYVAQLRQLRSGGLAIGQLATPYAAAMYDVVSEVISEAADASGLTQKLRISRVLRGKVHMVHSTDKGACEAFNRRSREERQLLRLASHRPKAATSNFTYHTIHSLVECERVLGRGGRALRLHGDRMYRDIGTTLLANRSRQLCAFRDVGPRVSRELHAILAAAARARNASAAKMAYIDTLLHALGGYHSYYTAPRSPLSHAARDSNGQQRRRDRWRGEAWPPIFRPRVESSAKGALSEVERGLFGGGLPWERVQDVASGRWQW